jgi:hypothetical protein
MTAACKTPERQVRALFTTRIITVYQAYPPDIAERALTEGTFAPPFKLERMTWIKPSSLCGPDGPAGLHPGHCLRSDAYMAADKKQGQPTSANRSGHAFHGNRRDVDQQRTASWLRTLRLPDWSARSQAWTCQHRDPDGSASH